MICSLRRCALGLMCALSLIFGPLASSSSACLFGWGCGSGCGYGCGYGGCTAGYGGYRAAYAPVSYGSYTAGYGGYRGGCCLGGLFSGCGLFGCARPTYVNYAPSYCAPCGGCSPCNPCGAGSCGTCGVSSYGGLCNNGCATGDCGINSGGTVTPYSGEPVEGSGAGSATEQFTPSTVPNRTYREDDGDFSKPEPVPGTGSGDMVLPGADATSSDASGVTPAGGTAPETEIQRDDGGFDFESFKIPAKNPPEEAEGENSSESRRIEPLDVDAQVAFRAASLRTRALYRTRFNAPAVTRTHVPVSTGWEAIDSPAKLANQIASGD